MEVHNDTDSSLGVCTTRPRFADEETEAPEVGGSDHPGEPSQRGGEKRLPELPPSAPHHKGAHPHVLMRPPLSLGKSRSNVVLTEGKVWVQGSLLGATSQGRKESAHQGRTQVCGEQKRGRPEAVRPSPNTQQQPFSAPPRGKTQKLQV